MMAAGRSAPGQHCKHPFALLKSGSKEEEEEETETTYAMVSHSGAYYMVGIYIYRGSAESAMHGCHVTPNPPAYQPVEMRILYICTQQKQLLGINGDHTI
jgi:hypothetical protein